MEFRAAMSYSSGEIYEGQFFKGMRHGLMPIYVNGICTRWRSEGLSRRRFNYKCEGKLVCQGEFVEGAYMEIPRLRGWPQYTGEWKESRRHGQGKYVDVDGKSTKGE